MIKTTNYKIWKMSLCVWICVLTILRTTSLLFIYHRMFPIIILDLRDQNLSSITKLNVPQQGNINTGFSSSNKIRKIKLEKITSYNFFVILCFFPQVFSTNFHNQNLNFSY